MSKKRGKKDRQVARREPGSVAASDGLRNEIVTEAIAFETVAEFSGPLPPPGFLSGYDRVMPGLATRLVAMAEGEAEHRRMMQRRYARLAEVGLLSGFVLAMTVIVGGLYLVHEGASNEGIGSILAGLAALMVVYLTRGRRPPPEK